MKKSRLFPLLVIFILFFLSSLVGAFHRTPPRQNITPSDTNATKLGSSALCDLNRTIPIPYGAHDLTFCDGYIWMTSYLNASLFKIDPNTGDTVSSFPLIDYGIGLATDGKVFYVSFSSFTVIYAFNGTILGLLNANQYVGLAWDGQYLWGSDGTQIHRIDPNNGTHLTTFPIPAA